MDASGTAQSSVRVVPHGFDRLGLLSLSLRHHDHVRPIRARLNALPAALHILDRTDADNLIGLCEIDRMWTSSVLQLPDGYVEVSPGSKLGPQRPVH